MTQKSRSLLPCFQGLACCLLLLTLVSGCAVNPVTGETQLMLISEQDEARIGYQTEQSVKEQYGAYPSSRLQEYIESIGMPMARSSHRPDLDWSFEVMDSPVVNAFAAPGGYVFITRGMLAAINDEAELAGVLGHEIGHVTARHSATQYSNQVLANLGVELGKTVAGDLGGMIGPMLETGTGLLFLKFSRDDERQSDTIGVEYSTRAGYDARRTANFFATLQRMQTLDENGGRLPEWFSTHPNPVDREASVRRQAIDWQARLPQKNFRVDRDRYLDQIDGLVYGKDPRMGFREGERYYFPQYRVSFKVPQQWSFKREGTQVQMLHPQKRTLVVFGIEEQASLDQVAAKLVKSLQARVLKSDIESVQGMPVKWLYCVAVQDNQKILIKADLFLKDGRVFMFYGMALEQEYGGYAAQLGLPADSFSILTERDKLNRQPQRLSIKRIERSMTLQTALQKYRVDQQLWNRVAWLNALRLTDMLSPGQRIKVLQ
jgi:predicted Zn-dependent protease